MVGLRMRPMRNLDECSISARRELPAESLKMVGDIPIAAGLEFHAQRIRQESQRDLIPIGTFAQEVAHRRVDSTADMVQRNLSRAHAECLLRGIVGIGKKGSRIYRKPSSDACRP